MIRLKECAAICLPLHHSENIFGIVYLDNLNMDDFVSNDNCIFVEKFADFISPVAYRVLERKKFLNRVTVHQQQLSSNHHFEAIIGQHPQMMQILKMVAQVAEKIFNVPKVIARVFDPQTETIYRQFGIETICPTNKIAEDFLDGLS